ncbi:MAG TPA: acyl-CoA dehydrogenase C-terminal domain-containing protein [Accumulibacter sp.]|nr:acyl-CoA dehydrogenase C-terminal domain-containing protein [Accumulibacter sp.]HMW18937.1 acyl-CoA dehydrogenase C-terminal domain-containing protein [Accumulibacter sp.]HMX21810.1 acyl-CoA dehydrogenase C-terminal domain-containing protein [Accumulibacter sp.]HMY07020.1 acyl-CoA dehydrogenase C-terminal domain-containing protein [Accumulibacter sp.]HNC16822.1 acyl-CoA dehydrogenase C-terminal domain-containing protein [Accumulibacter sp.]
MSEYIAPIRDMQFVLQEIAGLDQVAQLPGCEEATHDLVDAVLEEAGKFASEVLSPLNYSGDQEGAVWHDKQVTMPAGFKDAYRLFAESGWPALACETEWGGQGLPKLVSAAVAEMWKSANHAFSLCPLLTAGAIEALVLSGSDKLKETYLEKMVSGEWTGTMNLTEPNAGSDLAAVRTRAEPQPDGRYKIFGQKIFITYGEHDLTENIIHLVLARTPNAPEGVKGISLFVVPKFMVNEDGSLGERNDAYCVSIEHKLGIHASPTSIIAFGDQGGAIGDLVGEENRGLEYMFIMMNAARFGVGLEGVAVCERAYQRARDYARERIQCTDIGVRGGPKVAIIHHPDVRRMLMTIRAHAEASRALAYSTAAALDAAAHHPDDAERKRNQAFADLMIPVVKGWSTECGVTMASIGVQVHGGMGYVEETGAAQHLRDAQISTIYEGTTGIQANDLIGRKMAREGGATLKALLVTMRALDADLAGQDGEHFASLRRRFTAGIDAVERAADWLIATYGKDVRAASAGAVPFLKLLGTVAGGWMMARSALAAQARIDGGSSDPFYPAKIATARFYADHVLSQADGLASSIVDGAVGVLAFSEDMF